MLHMVNYPEDGSDASRAYQKGRDSLVAERVKLSRQREGMEDALRRIDIAGARTESDLRYTMRNLKGEHADGLLQKLVQLEDLREDARDSIRRQMSEVEEREQDLAKRIRKMDEEFEISQQKTRANADAIAARHSVHNSGPTAMEPGE